eukprot:UN02761
MVENQQQRILAVPTFDWLKRLDPKFRKYVSEDTSLPFKPDPTKLYDFLRIFEFYSAQHHGFPSDISRLFGVPDYVTYFTARFPGFHLYFIKWV